MDPTTRPRAKSILDPAGYTTSTKPIRNQLFLLGKRPREEWDPTLWEIPLLLLPKRCKEHAHSNRNDC